MKKFIAVLMSVGLGGVLCLSNTGCPKTPDKDKVKPPTPVTKDSLPPATDRPAIPPPPKDMPEGVKDKTSTDKDKFPPAKDKDKIEPAKDKKDKNGAFLPRQGLPLAVAELLRRPEVKVERAL